ncbi:hypothetical protein Efla_006515 [Eimeria flavescens]
MLLWPVPGGALLVCLSYLLTWQPHSLSAAAAAVQHGPAASAPFAAAAGAPDNHQREGASGALQDEDEFEFDVSPEDLPVPSAFAPRLAAFPPPQPAKARAAAAQPSPPAVPKALSEAWQLLVASHAIDGFALLLLLLVVFVAVQGTKRNTAVAAQWMEAVREVLKVQFAAVGEGEKGALTARSYSSFELFCSGRRHCVCMLATLDCLWRGHVLRRLLGFSRDLVTLEFILPEAGEGLILNLCRKEEQRGCMEAAWDLMEFSKVRHASSVVSQLPEGFSLMSDTQEAAERFLDIPGMQKHLLQLGPYLRCLYTSDLCTNTNPSLKATIASVFGSCAAAVKKPKRVLRLSYYLPAGDEEAFDHRLPIVVGCKLVDALASLRLSDAGRESVRKLRLAYEKEQQKHRRKEQQEAAERRRVEKKREQEKAVESLPEAQRRKAQEALEKKAAKDQRKEQRQGIRAS